MQDSTSPHHLTPVDPRIAALEDHLARETRSSQALTAEVRRLQAWCTDDATVLRLSARVKELEALCAVLGVVPELSADGEPRFLPLAEVRNMRPAALAYAAVCEDALRPIAPKCAAFFSALCDAEQVRDARKEAQ